MTESKFAKTLRYMKDAARCEHQFLFLRDHPLADGVVARCTVCRCRFTAWPGSAHYDEIAVARENAMGGG